VLLLLRLRLLLLLLLVLLINAEMYAWCVDSRSTRSKRAVVPL
jgi:hypothetical protein